MDCWIPALQTVSLLPRTRRQPGEPYRDGYRNTNDLPLPGEPHGPTITRAGPNPTWTALE